MIDDKTPAPEAVNTEQEDGDTQAQTVADEALARATSVLGEQDLGDKVGGSGLDDADMPDLVDHMKQMVSSGQIDMSAYRGERNDDDEAGIYGDGVPEDDDTPRGAE
ncbi:MAG: hypothetical protein ACO1OX_14750 [Novosphingobium sp.]